MTDPVKPSDSPFLGQGVKIDPASQKVDKLFFQRFLSICRPYWTRDGAWVSWLIMGAVIVTEMSASAAGGATTYLSQDIQNALVAKDPSSYWRFWIYFTGVGLAMFVIGLVSQYVSGYLHQDWRRWMTAYLIDEYLGWRTYYAITLDGDIDNPDQRIQEEIKPVIAMATGLPTSLLHSTLNIGVQVAILAAISVPMLIATFVYCAINGVFTYFVSKPTIRQNWNATVAEADLRFGLLHVRDHAETIAFYRGEKGERVHLMHRLATAVAAQWTIIRYQIKVSVAGRFMGLLWTLLPMVFVAPLYFTGKIEFGMIAAATTAAAMINGSIGTFVHFIPTMSLAVPHVVRISEIREKFEKLGAYQRTQHIGHFRREVGSDSIGFEHVTLMTPGGERTLFRNLTVEVPRGTRLLIVGPTGTGKSSALRALAGLWDLGQGTVRTSPEDETIYLPQRPYMVLGSLRHQLLYPGNLTEPPSDEEIVSALRASCLEEFVERHPDLSAVADWGRILSLGEQQRIGFARALLTSARFVFLDEATSAVDVETERRLYAELLSRKLTLISVGHRPTLLGYHNLVLELKPDGTGQVMSVEAYMASGETKFPRQSAG